MVEAKDLAAINKALSEGYEVKIRPTKGGIRIAAEKTSAVILRNDKENKETAIK